VTNEESERVHMCGYIKIKCVIMHRKIKKQKNETKNKNKKTTKMKQTKKTNKKRKKNKNQKQTKQQQKKINKKQIQRTHTKHNKTHTTIFKSPLQNNNNDRS